MNETTTGYTANHELEKSENFDFAHVDRHVFLTVDHDAERAREIHQESIQMLYGFLRWIAKCPTSDKAGLSTRTVALFWILLPEYESMTLTELAEAHGCTKQNISKIAGDFKKDFPRIRNKHMKGTRK